MMAIKQVMYGPRNIFSNIIDGLTCDLAIPIPALLTRQVDDGLCQGGLVIRQVSLIPLRGAGLPQHSTDPTFRQAQRRTAVSHRLPSARWA